MAKLISEFRAASRVLWGGILWIACAHAAPPETRPDDYVVRAKQLLLRLYPGLDGNLHAAFTDMSRLRDAGAPGSAGMNSSFVELHDLDPKPGKSSACWCSDPALHAYIVFQWQTHEKELFIFSAGGRVVDGRTNAFTEAMRGNPEWSDEQVLVALNAAGARFGPDIKAEFLRAVPVDELKPFAGRLEVVSAEFSLRGNDLENRPVVRPYWYVRANWLSPTGRKERRSLTFEAFDGRLMSIQTPP